MPISVQIAINGRSIETLHIGRDRGGSTAPDSINNYFVVQSDHYPSSDEWYSGSAFTHRYGDGVESCVMHALEALKRDNKSV